MEANMAQLEKCIIDVSNLIRSATIDYKIIIFNVTPFNPDLRPDRQGYHPAILASNLAIACNMNQVKECTNIMSNLCGVYQ